MSEKQAWWDQTVLATIAAFVLAQWLWFLFAYGHELAPLVFNALRGRVEPVHLSVLLSLVLTVGITYGLDRGASEASKVWPYWPSRP